MADTTVTTLTELVNSEFINPAILEYAHDFTVAAPFVNWLDLRGKGTKVGSFPRWVLDTATDTGETTDLTTEALETLDVQITAAEIGVRRDVTDAALEETIIGSQLFDFLVRDSGVLAAISLDDDICALFTGFSNSVGLATTDLALSHMVEAQAKIRINGARGSLVYVLDDQQASDFQAAQVAATSTTVGAIMDMKIGAIDNGYLGTFFGHPVWQTGLCDSSNTGASVNGACFVRGDVSPSNAAIGGVITRDVRTELDRDISARQTEFVMTAKWGVGEILDTSGVRIKTDA